MTERPILFSTPMVQALLADRKTQTRRIAQLNAAGRVEKGGRNWHVEDASAVIACPYGYSGDTLWVREAFRIEERGNRATGEKFDVYVYKADSRLRPEFDPLRYKPSIHMPRAASRITLQITEIRIERLHSISSRDCWAEGIEHSPDVDPRHEYRDLWEEINGVESWAANPLVWVVCFSVIKDCDDR